jgi:hypothetical protein
MIAPPSKAPVEHLFSYSTTITGSFAESTSPREGKTPVALLWFLYGPVISLSILEQKKWAYKRSQCAAALGSRARWHAGALVLLEQETEPGVRAVLGTGRQRAHAAIFDDRHARFHVLPAVEKSWNGPKTKKPRREAGLRLPSNHNLPAVAGCGIAILHKCNRGLASTNIGVLRMFLWRVLPARNTFAPRVKSRR